MSYSTLPAISCGVSLLFASAVLWQYLRRRKPYQLIWGVGLLMYAISTGCEFFMESNGLNTLAYRMWYLFGAVLVAAYLGMGTVYLLASRRLARFIVAILVIASVCAAVNVFTAPVDFCALPTSQLEISGEALPSTVRLMTPFFNVFGTVALVGGAMYSVWVFRRQAVMRHRVVANILVAVGALLPAVGGSLNRLGGLYLLYLLELLGVLVIFAGFLLSNKVPDTVRAAQVRQPSQST